MKRNGTSFATTQRNATCKMSQQESSPFPKRVRQMEQSAQVSAALTLAAIDLALAMNCNGDASLTTQLRVAKNAAETTQQAVQMLTSSAGYALTTAAAQSAPAFPATATAPPSQTPTEVLPQEIFAEDFMLDLRGNSALRSYLMPYLTIADGKFVTKCPEVRRWRLLTQLHGRFDMSMREEDVELRWKDADAIYNIMSTSKAESLRKNANLAVHVETLRFALRRRHKEFRLNESSCSWHLRLLHALCNSKMAQVRSTMQKIEDRYRRYFPFKCATPCIQDYPEMILRLSDARCIKSIGNLGGTLSWSATDEALNSFETSAVLTKRQMECRDWLVHASGCRLLAGCEDCRLWRGILGF